MKTAFELGFEKEAGGLGGAIIGAGIGAAGEGHRMSGAAIGGLGGGALGAGIGAGAKRRVRPGGAGHYDQDFDDFWKAHKKRMDDHAKWKEDFTKQWSEGPSGSSGSSRSSASSGSSGSSQSSGSSGSSGSSRSSGSSGSSGSAAPEFNYFNRAQARDGSPRMHAYKETLGFHATPPKTKVEAKKAYHRMTREHHPDMPGGDAEKFKKVNKAWENYSKSDEFSKMARAMFEKMAGILQDSFAAARAGTQVLTKPTSTIAKKVVAPVAKAAKEVESLEDHYAKSRHSTTPMTSFWS